MTQQTGKGHFALIMAGGEGTRFQPISTPARPKQFLTLLNREQSLLQETFSRLHPFFNLQNIWIATNQHYTALVTRQLPKLPSSQIVAETVKKNTAPCLAWGTREITRKKHDAVIVALPADHFITPISAFQKVLQQGLTLAEAMSTIVTIGIPPTTPSTEYGYIHFGEKENGHYKVKKFVEKPNPIRAKIYVENGSYYWNSGIFFYPAQNLLEQIARFLPEIHQCLQEAVSIEDFFEKTPAISIDYGVMEKTKNILMLEADFTWSDVGTWDSLAQLSKEYALPLSKEVQTYLANRDRKPPQM